MQEKLFMIPVNDAFHTESECPVCSMYQELERKAVEFTMGTSYMEDDIRAMTDETGFCPEHVKQLLAQNNRLGLALVMKTHMDKTNREIKKLAASAKPGSLFKKKDSSALTEYIKNLNHSCFVCNKVNQSFDRYISTIFHLWKNDEDFRKRYVASKGFCTTHYGILIEKASAEMGGRQLEDFIDATNKVYLENMERVNDDLQWFINKFDYKYKDEPWKDAKDALPRALTKVNSLPNE